MDGVCAGSTDMEAAFNRIVPESWNKCVTRACVFVWGDAIRAAGEWQLTAWDWVMRAGSSSATQWKAMVRTLVYFALEGYDCVSV